MKFSTSRDTFLSNLQAIGRVASTRSAIQALAGVEITASQEAVELHATDGEVGLRVPLEATVESEGSSVLPARLLIDIVRSLSAGNLTLELRPEERDVEVTGSGAVFHVRTLRGDDFPPLPEPGGGATAELPTDAFVETVLRVARSASRDETRPVLTGILVSADARQLRMVATDSYRLSVKETELATDVGGSFDINVPARALQELARLAQGTENETVRVTARENQVVFELGRTVLSSRLLEGQFPNYRGLLPDSFEHELAIGREELADVVRRISLLAQKNTPLKLAFRDGELTVSAQTPDVGEAHESIPVPFQGEPLDVGFNPEFLQDGLESVESGDVLLKLISPLRPGLLQSSDASGFLYLIMPIRLNV